MPATKEKRPFEQTLSCELTDAELLNYGQLAAVNAEKIAEKESELAEIKKAYKEQIDALDVEMRNHLHLVRRKSERRLVECEWRLDEPSIGQKTAYRLDTGEAFQVADMTTDEMQRSFDLESLADPAEEQEAIEEGETEDPAAGEQDAAV